ncbi:MAG: cation-translocating P-type ATPase [Thermaerobacterales bacterium]
MPSLPQPWHSWTAAQALRYWASDGASGLVSDEVERRRGHFGLNVFEEEPAVPAWKILAAQFRDMIVLILLAATLISAALGEFVDALVIFVIIILNAVMGFFYEYRAEQALLALRGLVSPVAQVIREGRRTAIAAEELLPGDICLLEAGDRVPGDLRLINGDALMVDEAALTGESIPVAKDPAAVCREDAVIGERTNMMFQGTSVAAGRGRAVVVATGMATEMGRIAGLIDSAAPEETPLQKRLAELGSFLVAACLLVCAMVVGVGILNGEAPYTMLLAGVSLAVAAIPEGLPAVVTIVLAIGVQRMVRVRAIIRRLPAVETLGCTTAVCSDKTGTLTLGRMKVRELWLSGSRQALNKKAGPDAGYMLAAAGVYCNNTEALPDGQLHGSPTEVSLAAAVREIGYDAGELGRHRRLAEIPFDSKRKRMTVICRTPAGDVSFTKGAPEVVLERCRRWRVDGRDRPLTPADRLRIQRGADEMAGDALRVLAVAYRPLGAGEAGGAVERDLVLLGLVGLADPPRPEVPAAIERCRRAGIRVYMITGDHRNTAEAVARELGMVQGPNPGVLTGHDLENLSDRELAGRAEQTSLFVRVSPEHKLRIIRALKSRGHIVAMTGDGVNDAPAVKAAHIGVAMGVAGTDVTREAASMVLMDDNFATIVNAVEQGRALYDNIRKIVRYLLASNLGEVLVMLLGALMRLPLPLLPIHILFVNLVTDGLPAVALGLEPPEKDVMDRKPRGPRESLFSRGLGARIIVWGHVIGFVALAVFTWTWWSTGDVAHARTAALASLVVSQMFHVLDCRFERPSGRGGPAGQWWGNVPLAGAILSTMGLLMLVIYWTPLQEAFRTVPLTVFDWLVITLSSGLWMFWLGVVRRLQTGGVIAKEGALQ